MKYIKTYEAYINANNYEEKDESEHNYGDDELFQREMRIKELRKKYKDINYNTSSDIKDFKDTAWSPIKSDDMPLDKYLKWRKEKDLEPKKNRIETSEEEIIKLIRNYDTLENFKKYSKDYYNWIIRNKKEYLLKYYDTLKSENKEFIFKKAIKEMDKYDYIEDFQEKSPKEYKFLSSKKNWREIMKKFFINENPYLGYKLYPGKLKSKISRIHGKENSVKKNFSDEKEDRIKKDLKRYKYLGNYRLFHPNDYNWLIKHQRFDLMNNLEQGSRLIRIKSYIEIIPDEYKKYIPIGYPKVGKYDENKLEMTTYMDFYKYKTSDSNEEGYEIRIKRKDYTYKRAGKIYKEHYVSGFFTFEEALKILKKEKDSDRNNNLWEP